MRLDLSQANASRFQFLHLMRSTDPECEPEDVADSWERALTVSAILLLLVWMGSLFYPLASWLIG